MSKLEKLLLKLSSRPKNFTYTELSTLLVKLGYEEKKMGKTSGSRVAFVQIEKEHIIRLHKPHPGNELKRYQIDYVREELTRQGYIS
ncbi:MAG: type II toxin-antitoxin system HicA family toxin [Bacteroidia bacterium]|nr:type II toxin-antitoxin system HicA family toxin [Bacteroidia bacterium]